MSSCCRRPAASRYRSRPSSLTGRGPRLVGWVLALCLVVLCGCTSPSDSASTHRSGAGGGTDRSDGAPVHWLVALGDSYISGEGARWAGNTSGPSRQVDALGADAYGSPDRPQSDCDRAAMSVAALGGGSLRGKNLACSGATIATRTGLGSFVPGLDWYHDGRGRVSQLVALRRFASSHQVSDIVVSIGGNDFGFGSVLTACVSDFASTVATRPVHCKDDPEVAGRFGPAAADAISRRLAAALIRVSRAMTQAGQSAGSYRIVVDTYPSPIAPGSRIRYPEALLQRLFLGGCPLFDADATWANTVVLPVINAAVRKAARSSHLSDVSVLDLGHLFDGHRLCETGSSQLQQTRPRLRSWRSPGAMAQLEWVNELYTKSHPWRGVESFHPNYWGTLAELRCTVAATSAGRWRSGVCRGGAFHAVR
jgi:hypothetical protein